MNNQPLVLVADDEPRITKLVAISLGDEGFRSSQPVAARRPSARPRRCGRTSSSSTWSCPTWMGSR